jgi:lipoyl(octanoyl) transferase
VVADSVPAAIVHRMIADPTTRPPVTTDWGRTRYEPAWRRQEEHVARRITGEIGDTLVFTEHEPVFTIGLRGGADAHLVWTAEQLERQGVEVVRTNRGGDITYHGPGQVVGYPIVSLAARRDLHAYLRFLEEVLMGALGTFGLAAARREGKTGIWIERRKIAAIGVAVRRWVTYHGFALNVTVNLDHFGGIVPCGIGAAEGGVTSIQAELGRPVDLAQVKAVLATEFWRRFPFLVTATSAAVART